MPFPHQSGCSRIPKLPIRPCCQSISRREKYPIVGWPGASAARSIRSASAFRDAKRASSWFLEASRCEKLKASDGGGYEGHRDRRSRSSRLHDLSVYLPQAIGNESIMTDSSIIVFKGQRAASPFCRPAAGWQIREQAVVVQSIQDPSLGNQQAVELGRSRTDRIESRHFSGAAEQGRSQVAPV